VLRRGIRERRTRPRTSARSRAGSRSRVCHARRAVRVPAEKVVARNEGLAAAEADFPSGVSELNLHLRVVAAVERRVLERTLARRPAADTEDGLPRWTPEGLFAALAVEGAGSWTYADASFRVVRETKP